MEKKYLSIGIIALGIVVALGVQGFGFEKNIDNRKGADAESVAGCMQSCEDMLAGWLEMNPESPNYTRQQEKIEAKAEQCLAMNELAGFPYSEEEILQSCGLGPVGPSCTTDADCDDGNPCTVDHCIPTGPRAGCIYGIPVGDGQSCFLDGAVGVCVGSQCTIQCVEVSPEQIHSGACKDFSFIDGENLPQCCSLEGGPSGDLLCGTEEEWVVGVTAFPICYIPGS